MSVFDDILVNPSFSRINKKSNLHIDSCDRVGLLLKTPFGIIMGHTPNEPRDENGWDLIKGHIERGEDIKKAAARETKEECGLEIDTNKLIELGKNRYREGFIVFFGYELPDFTYDDFRKLNCTSMFTWYTDEYGAILSKNGPISKYKAEFKELDIFDLVPPEEVEKYMYQGLYKSLTKEAHEFIGDN